MIAINMKMPKNCVECRFSQGDYGFCHAMPENFVGYVYDNEDEGKPDWCPLIPVFETDYKNGGVYGQFIYNGTREG